MLCPICNHKLAENIYIGERGIEEEYQACQDGCGMYAYQFAYGDALTTVGEIEVKSHYSDSSDDLRYQSTIIKEAVAHAKQRWESYK